jgi:anti-anti-sigma regulatory factor
VAEHDLVVIDVSKAEFIDLSFLQNLLVADRQARERGSRVRLQHDTKPVVDSALRVSGVLTLLESFSTREDALAP